MFQGDKPQKKRAAIKAWNNRATPKPPEDVAPLVESLRAGKYGMSMSWADDDGVMVTKKTAVFPEGTDLKVADTLIALAAENERLREALCEIADGGEYMDLHYDHVARKALQETSDD